MSFLLAGAESVPQLSSTRVAGYPPSPRGRNDAQLFAQSRTLRIRQTAGLDLSIARSTSPLQPVAMLPLRDFHKVSRAAGPKMTNRKLSTRTYNAQPVLLENATRTERRRSLMWIGSGSPTAREVDHRIAARRPLLAPTSMGSNSVDWDPIAANLPLALPLYCRGARSA